MERKRKIEPFKSKNQLGFNYFMNSLNTPGKTLYRIRLNAKNTYCTIPVHYFKKWCQY